MSEKTIVDLIEEWQTGFFLVLGAALVGFCTAVLLSSLGSPVAGLVGFAGGAILAFLAFSYLLYGR
jgi:hypothetical protein